MIDHISRDNITALAAMVAQWLSIKMFKTRFTPMMIITTLMTIATRTIRCLYLALMRIAVTFVACIVCA